MKKLIQRFKAETPRFNKILGRIFTFVSAKLVVIEVIIQSNNLNAPTWMNYAITASAIGCALFAGYNGQKTIK